MRKKIKAILAEFGFENAFTVRTVGFADLARGEAKVVTIKNWKPDRIAYAIEARIKAETGALVDFE